LSGSEPREQSYFASIWPLSDTNAYITDM